MRKILGFKIPKLNRSAGMTDVDFIREFFNLNREQFQQIYENELEKARNTDKRQGYSDAEKNFLRKYPDAHAYVSDNIVRYKKIKKLQIVKATEFAITKSLGYARSRYIDNFFSGLEKYGIKEDFMFYINEEFDYGRMDVEANTVTYITRTGKKVVLDYENSPVRILLYVNGEEVESYGEETREAD